MTTQAQRDAAEATAKMTEALVAFAETQLAAMLAAVAGYRQQVVDAGFSPNAAEGMAMQYHWFLIQRLHGVAGAL